MSWELEVWSVDGSTQIKTITDGIDPTTNEACVRGTPLATVKPPGVGEEMTFRARRDLFGAGPRQRIQYRIDGQDVFAGVIIVCPPPNTSGAGNPDEDALERYVCSSYQLIMEQTEAAPMLFPDRQVITTPDQDFALVAERLVTNSAPAGVTIAGSPSIGEDCPGFFAPAQSLASALDELAGQVSTGAVWYVDAIGRFSFAAS